MSKLGESFENKRASWYLTCDDLFKLADVEKGALSALGGSRGRGDSTGGGRDKSAFPADDKDARRRVLFATSQ